MKLRKRGHTPDTRTVWSVYDEAVRPPSVDVAREYARTLDTALLERVGDERPAAFLVRALTRVERDIALARMVSARSGGVDSAGLGVVYHGACFDMGVVGVSDVRIGSEYADLPRESWDLIPDTVRQDIGALVERLTEGLDDAAPF